MHITRKNYEQYFLDFTEGRLDPSMEKELQVFLDTHPDLKAELEEFRIYLLDKGRENYPDKDKLRKTVFPVGDIHESNINEYLFNYLEDTLDEKERADLERFLEKNPAFTYDLETWNKTRLQPDGEISFPDKMSLKRKIYPLGNISLRIVIPAAALILILVTIGGAFLFSGKQKPVSPTERNPVTTGQAAEPVQTMPSIRPENNDFSIALPDERKNLPVTPSVKIEQFMVQREETSSLYSLEPLTALAVSSHSPDNTGFTPELRTVIPASAMYDGESRSRLIGRILGNFIHRGKEILVNESVKTEKSAEPSQNGLMRFASATIKGYNTLTDNNVAIEVRQDQKGNVLGYALINNDEVVLSRHKNSQ